MSARRNCMFDLINRKTGEHHRFDSAQLAGLFFWGQTVHDWIVVKSGGGMGDRIIRSTNTEVDDIVLDLLEI